MLKQLRLAKELELKRSKLTEILTREAEHEVKSEELVRAISESESAEDIQLVDASVEELETAKAELLEEKQEVEAAIEAVEEQLKELNKQAEEVVQSENKETKNTQIEERGNVKMTKQYLEIREVKDFYEGFRALKTRGVTGELLTVPQVVIDRVMVLAHDYATLYPIVEKINVKGEARVLIDVDESGATWMEMTGAFTPSEVGSITNIDFDGFKLGKLTTVHNSILQDSIINLDAYVTKKLAKAIAKSLDAAILNGKGASQKQPEGIITNLAADHKIVKPATSLADIVAPIGLIDTGEQAVGNIVAVMNRQTYYNHILALDVNANSNGKLVGTIPNLANPTILGLNVVFSAHMAPNEILFGDFQAYTLVVREDITIEKSEHAYFAEDQLAFRGKGRFDGKPTNANAFVLLTIATAPVA